MTDYTALNQQLSALIHGVPHQTANLSNAAALLYHTLPDLNWAGFYLMEDGLLVLGPFQGKPACIEIQVGRGVCGTAVAEDRTQLVYDVHQFPGHIACDCASNSEIVIPLSSPFTQAPKSSASWTSTAPASAASRRRTGPGWRHLWASWRLSSGNAAGTLCLSVYVREAAVNLLSPFFMRISQTQLSGFLAMSRT